MACRICEVSDPGNHIQNNCCRACATFFRRTVKLKLQYKCKKISDCKITKDYRFICRYCRMQKCIKAGMTDPYLENSNASTGPYVHSSASFQLSPETFGSLPFAKEVDDFYSVDNILTNYNNFIGEYREKLRNILSNESKKTPLPFGLSLHQQATIAYEAQKAKWPECTSCNLTFSNVVDAFSNGFKAVQHAAEFCMEFSQFSQLPLDQKSSVMDYFAPTFVYFVRFFLTCQMFGTDVTDTRLIYRNCRVTDLRFAETDAAGISNCPSEVSKSIFMSEESGFISVLSEFKRLNPDRFEVMYLLLASMWNLQGISEATSKLALEIQDRLTEELFFYYKFDKKLENFASRIYKLQNMFTSIERLDELCEQPGEDLRSL